MVFWDIYNYAPLRQNGLGTYSIWQPHPQEESGWFTRHCALVIHCELFYHTYTRSLPVRKILCICFCIGIVTQWNAFVCGEHSARSNRQVAGQGSVSAMRLTWASSDSLLLAVHSHMRIKRITFKTSSLSDAKGDWRIFGGLNKIAHLRLGFGDDL